MPIHKIHRYIHTGIFIYLHVYHIDIYRYTYIHIGTWPTSVCVRVCVVCV
jgi:hypothetical protein